MWTTMSSIPNGDRHIFVETEKKSFRKLKLFICIFMYIYSILNIWYTQVWNEYLDCDTKCESYNLKK